MLSFDRRAFSFSWENALALLESGRNLCAVNFASEAVLTDALQAVCLLLEDGMELTFAHRSFQEYFAARYIQAAPPEHKEKLVERVVPNLESDNVMGLLHELEPRTVEQYYLLPLLAQLRSRFRIHKWVGVTHYLRFLKFVMRDFRLDGQKADPDDWHISLRDVAAYQVLRFTWERYSPNYALVSRTDYAPHVKRVAAAFLETYAVTESVSSSQLSARTPLVRALMEHPGIIGLQGVQDIFDAELEIRKAHAQSGRSLELAFANRRRLPSFV